MKVMGARVLIKKLQEPDEKSIIEVVHLDDEPSQWAEVKHSGVIRLPKGQNIELECKKGDIVLTKKYCGTPVVINGEQLHFVEYDDVLAIVE